MTAEVTHNHPEGIKGAEATAAAIYLSREGHGKEEIRKYITEEFGYDLSRTCDQIRPGYHHVETCQETVPEAIIASRLHTQRLAGYGRQLWSFFYS